MDSLIAFKANLVYCIGIFMITVLRLLYQSPRPFWSDGDISVINASYGLCDFTFANPNDNIFNVFFYYFYTLYMYFVRYTTKPNWCMVYLVSGLNLLAACLLTYADYIFGITYLYQAGITLLYSIAYLLLCINFDMEL